MLLDRKHCYCSTDKTGKLLSINDSDTGIAFYPRSLKMEGPDMIVHFAVHSKAHICAYACQIQHMILDLTGKDVLIFNTALSLLIFF